MLHKIGRPRVVSVRVHSENLLPRNLPVSEMTQVKVRISPVTGPPIHHETMILVAGQLPGISLGIEGIEGSDAGSLHRGITSSHSHRKRPLNVSTHLSCDCRHSPAFASELSAIVGFSG